MTLTYFWGHGGQFKHDNFQFSLVNTITQQILIALGPNLYHGCIWRVSWLSSKMDDLDLFLRSRGSILTWQFAIFACKHDNSTNINRIGLKLIPWMYLKSVLVKFEDGWPWPNFEVTGVNLNMTIFNFRL